MVRVVIDTNVWISAALSKSGTPHRFVKLVHDRCLPVYSSETFLELETRFLRPKFDRYLNIEFRRKMLHEISAAGIWVEVPSEISAVSYCRDVDDDKFIHTALAGNAAWLVSGDPDLLEAPDVPGLRILSPSEACLLPEFH